MTLLEAIDIPQAMIGGNLFRQSTDKGSNSSGLGRKA